MDIKWKKAAIFDNIVSHILDAEAENPGSTSAARKLNLIHVEQLQINGYKKRSIQHVLQKG